MLLSIIIINYNVKYFLEQCLFSVTKACRNIDAEIFMVDNNSTDGSKDFFIGKFASVKFIWNKENVGFAKANNQVLQQCAGEYILFLNPDTIVAEDCFEQCIAFIKSQQTPGALGVHLIDGTGNFLKESKRAFPSPLTSLYKLSGLTSLFPQSKTFARYYSGNLNEHQNNEVDVLVGAFMLIPKSVITIVGSFDESFFMYGEDVDLSYRIQKAGFKNYYYAQTSVIHFKGESTKKGSLNYVHLFYRAMSLFVKKHYSGSKATFFNFLMQVAIWIRAIFSGIAIFLKKIYSNFTFSKRNKAQKILIIADEKQYHLLVSALTKPGPGDNIIIKVSNESPANPGISEMLSQLHLLIKKYAATEIIFCEGDISYKEIIALIQQLPKNIHFKFHSAGSESIIGSYDKNIVGDCIVLDK